jgi:hypothetical protein
MLAFHTMNLLLGAQCRRSVFSPWPLRQCLQRRQTGRLYATHHGLNSSTLSQSLDTKSRPYRPRESVGPFQLGISQSTFENGEKVKKWSELSTVGKGTWAKICCIPWRLIIALSSTEHCSDNKSGRHLGRGWTLCRSNLLSYLRALLQELTNRLA